DHDRRAADEKLEALPVNYGTGGNGARVQLDLAGPVIGFQLYDRAWDHALGAADGISRDLRTAVDFLVDLPGLARAIVAHNERCQREADEETENQRNGDYAPVILEARDTLRPGIQLRPPKKRTTPRVDRPRPLRISDTP